MLDPAKAAAVRTAIEALAADYDSNGIPDVAKALRGLAALSPVQLARLGERETFRT